MSVHVLWSQYLKLSQVLKKESRKPTEFRNCSDMYMSRIITVSFEYLDECDICKFMYLFFCPKKVQFLSSRHWIEFVYDA